MHPNARDLLIKAKTIGTDPIVDKIVNEPGSAEGLLYAKVLELNKIPLRKQYIEASLLASKDLTEIAGVLEMPIDLLTMYRDVLYNVTDLDKLSKMDLMSVPDNAERVLKMWAMSQGLSFIRWRLGEQVDVSPIEGLKDLFTTCVFKSKEAMFNPNISEASKESTKYIKLSMDLARLLKVWVMDSAAAKHDIEIALKEVMPNFGGLDELDVEVSSDAPLQIENGIPETSLAELV